MALACFHSSKDRSLSHQLTLILLSFLAFGASPSAANTQFDQTPGSCQIIGDQDVYGIGIRLSYYLQWAAVLLGLWIAPQHTNRTRAASNIVTISVFINSFRGAKVEHSLMDVEWYIVQNLVFWLLVFNLPTSERAWKSSVGSLFVLLINYCFIQSFPVWLYFLGVDRGRKEGCDAKIFFWAAISSFNPKWILANKILSITGVIFVWVPFIGGFVLLFFGLFQWDDESEEDEADANPGLQAAFFGLLICFGAFSIAFVEMTIKSNDIVFPDVHLTDSGQLIPFLIGIFTLVAVLWEGFRKLTRVLVG